MARWAAGTAALGALFGFGAGAAEAAEGTRTATVAATTTATVASTTTATAAEPRSWLDDWVAIPIVFYTPETRLGLGGMIIYSFDGPENQGARRSNLQFRGFYTMEKQISFYLEPNVWMFGDFVGITGWMEWRKYPFKFYGVGNDPDLDVLDDYTEQVFEAIPQVTFRLHGPLRAGVNAHILTGEFKSYPADGLLVGTGAVGLGDLTAVGFGPTLGWDTRDSNFWPKAGSLVSLDLTIFNTAFGSDYSFTRFSADLRTYFNPWRDHALALQGLLRLSDGTVPFFFYPDLGGVRTLRGWYKGSLRDQHSYALQAEYRAPIWWRFGLVAFAGVGQVVPNLKDIDPTKLRGSVGGGLRFRLNDEGVNVRVDFAYGGQFEFYFQVGEAF